MYASNDSPKYYSKVKLRSLQTKITYLLLIHMIEITVCHDCFLENKSNLYRSYQFRIGLVFRGQTMNSPYLAEHGSESQSESQSQQPSARTT